MIRPTRGPAVLLAVIAGAVALTGSSALAYFTTTGAGSAASVVGSLGKPIISSATPAAGGTVTVSWSAVTPPGAGAVTYYVTRDGGVPAGTCPSSSAPAAVTTCTDKGVAVGSHTYVVTAVWQTWSATSAPASATVTVGEATHFTVSASSTSIAAGGSTNLTITAKDANESTVTTYTGSHSLTFSGASASSSGSAPTVANSSGTAVAFGSATALTFTAGVAAVSSSKNGLMKLYRAETAAISATDGTLSTSSPLSVAVIAAALSKFTLVPETTTPAAGAEDGLTITAQDTYSNTVTTYTGSHSLTFSGASASPSGVLPTVTDVSGNELAFGTATTIAFNAGVAATSGSLNGEMRLYKSGATSVKVAEGAITSAAVSVTVAPGAATKLALAATTLTPTAGASVNLTITAQDVYSNTDTTYAGTKNLTFSGASAGPGGNAPTVSNSSGTAVAFGSTTALTFTSGVATVSSAKNGVMKLYKAGGASVSATDGSISTPSALAITVAAAALSKFTLVPETTTPAAGAEDDLTITAQDTYANTVTTYTGSHSLTFSGASASPSGAVATVSDSSGNAIAFGTATSIAFTAGVATTSGTVNGEMHIYKSGVSNVKVTESAISSAAVAITVAPGGASKLALGSSATTLTAGGTANLTITAQDTYSNTVTTYTGSHSLTFSGASASPSGAAPSVVDASGNTVSFGTATPLTFTAGVAAVASSKNGVMKLDRAQVASIAATDGTISTVSGVTVTVSAGTAARLGLTGVVASAGSLGSPCLFTCVVTGLGNGGSVEANVAVTDSLGNTVSALGSGHSVSVTANGGTVIGSPLTIASAGTAESTTRFTYTAPASGAFTNTITAATSAGTVYTTATATASK